mgnify:CR=1 FL=1
MSIISTRQDLDAIAATDPVEHARFISLLRASLTSRIDVAEYPEGYDSTLTDGQDGYIPPVWQDVSTPETAARFGFTAEELAAL